MVPPWSRRRHRHSPPPSSWDALLLGRPLWTPFPPRAHRPLSRKKTDATREAPRWTCSRPASRFPPHGNPRILVEPPPARLRPSRCARDGLPALAEPTAVPCRFARPCARDAVQAFGRPGRAKARPRPKAKANRIASHLWIESNRIEACPSSNRASGTLIN